jgi:hypothetical protein
MLGSVDQRCTRVSKQRCARRNHRCASIVECCARGEHRSMACQRACAAGATSQGAPKKANAAAAASARHGPGVRPVPRLSAPTLDMAPSASSSCPASALSTASSATAASSGGSSCDVLAAAHAGRSKVVTAPLAWPTATQLPAVASATQSGSASSCAAPHCARTPSTACTDRLFAVQTAHSVPSDKQAQRASASPVARCALRELQH